MTSTIYTGDALQVLRTLSENSVHCVVTSPPYFALRDYGTGTWEGGDPACTHKVGEIRTGTNLAECSRQHGGGGSVKLTTPLEVKAREVCPHCGARRIDQQIGLEETPEQFIDALVAVFAEVRRVLRDDGTCWVNLGDSYNGQGARAPSIRDDGGLSFRAGGRAVQVHGLKPKDLIGIPWMVAFALRASGWWLRSDCIWAKPNPMPESVEDRPTKAHEYVFLLTKSERYFYDAFAVRQAYAESTLPQKGQPYGGVATKDYAQGRAQDPSDTKRRVVESLERRGGANLRTVWTIATQPFKGAHFATFPKALADRCILAGTSAHGCCPSCSAPWERVVEKRLAPTPKACRAGVVDERDEHADANDQGSNRQRDGHVPGMVRADVEKGWQPTCDCFGTWREEPLPEPGKGGAETVWGWQPPAEPMPPLRRCVVLDPFTGAGTTGLAATLLGRDFVGVELSPKFAAMARKRIADEMPLFAAPARAAGGGA